MPVKYHKGKFPPVDINYGVLAAKIEEASNAVARYDSFLGIIPNPEILSAPMITQEAVTSSKIEGTQASIQDVFGYEAGKTDISEAKKSDIREIINYRLALHDAEQMLLKLPISGRVIKKAHEDLMIGTRGGQKSPGEYRSDQNWIGITGCSIEDATYVPVSPHELEDAMTTWEYYVNSEESAKLIKTAVAHAEFESIHPFRDGNGRIGRMLIPLMMWKEGLIEKPCFYLSEYMEKHNEEYRDKLLKVSQRGEWTEWCNFFLDAVIKQAEINNQKARSIYTLNVGLKDKLAKVSGSARSAEVVDALFEASVFSRTKLISKCNGTEAQTVRRLLKILEDEKVILEAEQASGRKPAIYIFPELLKITEGIELKKAE